MTIALLTTGRHDLSYLKPLTLWLRDYYWIRVNPQTAFSGHSVVREVLSCSFSVADQLLRMPDRLVVVGDRTETLAACVVATCLRIPIAHIHGGDVTLGAIDHVCRNAISQLADMHFAATPDAAENLRKMNVPGAIHMTGSPAIDLLMAKKRKRVPGNDVVLAYHPETLSDVSPLEQIRWATGAALEHLPKGGKIICVGANPDAGGALINRYLTGYGDPFVLRTDMGSEEYWDLLSACHCLVGNSSSGIIEAPALGVPFVEIGDRQKGRYRGSYGDGHACERIAKVLTS